MKQCVSLMTLPDADTHILRTSCRIFGTTSPELTDYIGLVHIIIDNVDDSLKKGSIYTVMKGLRTNTERARRMRRLREIGRCSSLYPRRGTIIKESFRDRAHLFPRLYGEPGLDGVNQARDGKLKRSINTEVPC